MALIVEDGTGKPDADSYISLVDAESYFAARNLTLWADATFSDAEKEGCLRRATDYITTHYRSRWMGRRRRETQALDWPRMNVPQPDLGEDAAYIADSVVPAEVVRACAEMAWRAAFGELAPDEGRRALREKVDVIEVEYDPHATAQTRFRAVDALLAPYLDGARGGSAIRLVRA